jgi:hypothetical protein
MKDKLEVYLKEKILPDLEKSRERGIEAKAVFHKIFRLIL